ncbi:MAG: FAD-dependent oxidoreductase [Bacteroidota bacterium]
MSKLTVVIGAGAFGSWTAYQLIQKGVSVKLLDAWGPGHSRASSGGETRIIRSVYGADQHYIDWVAESYRLWTTFQAEVQEELFVEMGNLWMFSTSNDAYARQSIPLIRSVGLSIEEWTTEEAKQRFPRINFEDVHTVFYEKEAGCLFARKACQALVKAFVGKGGHYQRKQVASIEWNGAYVDGLRLSDGQSIKADQYIFACGPWLTLLFPDLLQGYLQVSRQAIGYYGLPAGQAGFLPPQFPIWIDYGKRIYYGIPGAANRGFKLADDTRGADFDPTNGHRLPDQEALRAHQAYLSHRFPALTNAPLIEARVCQYTNSPDGDFIIDRHPLAENVWLAGAGCGHAFKMGPVIGRHIARLVLGQESRYPQFSINRLNRPSAVKTQFDLDA